MFFAKGNVFADGHDNIVAHFFVKQATTYGRI